jgi:Na+-driven multidrug efflux pump
MKQIEPLNLLMPLLPVETRTERKLLQRLRDFFTIDRKLLKDMLLLTAQRMACFDYSFELLVLSYVIAQVQNEEGDSTDYQAAANLIIYFLNFGAAFTLYSLLPFIKIGSRLMGEAMQAANTQDLAKKLIAQRKYARLVKNSVLVGAIPAALSSALMFNAEKICNQLGQNPEVSRLLGQFTRPVSALFPIFIMRFLSDLLLFFNGKGSTVMWVTLGCWGLSGFGLSYILTLGKWSLPKMGVTGAFIGFLGQMLGSWLILNSVVKFNPSFEDYHFLRNLRRWTKDDRKQIREFIPLSLAYMATISSELLCQLATNLLVGKYPPNRAAAQNFWTLILFFSILFSQGLGQVANQMIGDFLGKNNIDLAQRAARYAVLLSVALPAPIYLTISLSPHLLMGLTQSVDPEVEELGGPIIRLACAVSMMVSIQFVAIESLKQTDKYVRPVVLSIAGLWAGFGISYLLSESYDYDALGVDYGAAAGAAIAMIVTLWEFKGQFIDKPAIQTGPLSLTLTPDMEKASFEEPPSPRSAQPRLSSNRYGCWNCFSRIYDRLFGSRQPEPEQAPPGLVIQ